MPSKSRKQKRFMAAAAKSPKFAKKAGISRKVAAEYHEADMKKMMGRDMMMNKIVKKRNKRMKMGY